MKKISLIFKDDRDADEWLLCLEKGHSLALIGLTRDAVIKVSTRRKKGKASL